MSIPLHSIPKLGVEQTAARDSVADHLRILACAGSGKTETVAQRVAKLIRHGVNPASIVAFTFTTKAAEELRNRILDRLNDSSSGDTDVTLRGLYVGTIHSFAYDLLRQNVTKFESYTLLDEAQLAAFILRYANRLDVKRFGDKDEMSGIRRILESLAVIENELLDVSVLPQEFSDCVTEIYELLESHKFLTFGLQIRLAAEHLQTIENRDTLLRNLQYLVVDEYQDVNPAQEKLIELMAKPLGPAKLTVVGDDDQSIYQWRGASVSNILNFSDKYSGAETYSLTENRRSPRNIVEMANSLASQISNRSPKEMYSSRNQTSASVLVDTELETETEEAEYLASRILELRAQGHKYGDIAVLVRASTSYPKILQAFEKNEIPVTPGGHVGLFETPEGDLFGKLFCWLADVEWRNGRWASEYIQVNLVDLVSTFMMVFELPPDKADAISTYLVAFKSLVGNDSRNISLVSEIYTILEIAEVKNWDLKDSARLRKLGLIGACTNFVRDYEVVMKKSRYKRSDDGTQLGSSDQGKYYFINLARHILGSAWESFKDGNQIIMPTADAVELLTVHSAKGLEWPIVFLPSMTASRFPNLARLSKPKDWILPREVFDADRYEGDMDDELRLMYVATTRAKSRLYLTAHKSVDKGKVALSPLLDRCFPWDESSKSADLPVTHDAQSAASPFIAFSAINDFIECGQSHLLRNILDFPSAIVEEIGYGNALHHALRLVGEFSSRYKRVPNSAELTEIITSEFFLPFASKSVANNMLESARALLSEYISVNEDSLANTVAQEKDVSLTTGNFSISGRVDALVEIDGEGLKIIDFKSNTADQDFSLQLQVYAAGLSQSGINVSKAEIHDLARQVRVSVDISKGARDAAKEQVSQAVVDLNEGKFDPNPSPSKCAYCDVRPICKSSAVK